MYKAILILDKFFLKYEGGGVGSNWLHPQEKLPPKSPALLELTLLFPLFDYSLLNFYKNHQMFVNNQ